MEVWKLIEGWGEAYTVSDRGRVRVMCKSWKVRENYTHHREEMVLSNVPTSNGYPIVCLSVNGKASTKRTHRLVAEAFIPNPLGLPQVNHINGIKTDNRVENLEWCTSKQNIDHAVCTGLRLGPQGEKHASHKLIELDVLTIRRRFSEGEKVMRISEDYRVGFGTIYKIIQRRTWSHI